MNPQTDNADQPPIAARPFRWLFNWRTIRRALIALACFATLVALFYTEEDWRGKRAWEKCKRDVESKGAVLDWAAYIPPPVPDDQNFFNAPGIIGSNWVGRGATELSDRISKTVSGNWRDTNNTLLVAEVAIAPSGAAPPPGETEAVLRFGDTNAPAEARKLIQDAVGLSATSARGFTFLAHPLNEIRPVRIAVPAEQTPTTNVVAGLFPNSLELSPGLPFQTRIQLEPAGLNSFRMLLSPAPVSAADYLDRSKALEPDFEVIRDALKRPYARMDGDYTRPYEMPIPGFILMRSLAQSLSDRTKCHLLLNEPEKALRDLTLLHGLCRVLEGRPTGKPMTLVAAMINVAINGLYTSTLAEGLRLHAWRRPELIAIQQQLAQINLPPIVMEAFVDERVATPATVDITSGPGLLKLFGERKRTLSDPIYTYLTFGPRGWIYQNMVVGSSISQMIIDICDPTNGLVFPGKAKRAAQELTAFHPWSPYAFLEVTALPNFTRAWQTTAHSQTLASQALIACALERYHLENKDYPETLDALAPRFIEKIPRDIIGGQPLHYRRADGSKFLLYSIGWNEKDDNGQIALDKNGNEVLENGDWVWQTK